MAWQEAARNLASREAKAYGRIQDGMSTCSLLKSRFIILLSFGLGNYIDGRVHALLAVASLDDISDTSIARSVANDIPNVTK
jgi:hypothetical protein